MIVSMRKTTILIQAKDAQLAISDVRRLGVLHIEHHHAPQGKDIDSLKEELGLIDEAAGILSSDEFSCGRTAKAGAVGVDAKADARHVVELAKRLSHLKEYSGALIQRFNQWEPWGDFDPEAIVRLRAKNIFIRLYEVPTKAVKQFPSNLLVQKISSTHGMSRVAVISREKVEVPFKEIPLPEMSLETMRLRLEEGVRVIETIRADICRLVPCLEDFKSSRLALAKELEFHQAHSGMGSAQALRYVSGFIPADREGELYAFAKAHHWAVITGEPSEEDMVPTLIRNPRWVEIISPVFKLLEIIPGYRELDISPLFLIFLSLFFGMIIGDAGYGAVYFLATFLLHRKLKSRLSDTRIFYLLYLFSSCAILWGVCTGTVFGQEWYMNAGLPAFIPLLNDTKFLQAFCFFLGAFHLSLGHAWQAVRKLPSLVALSDVGWICVLWSAFFIAKMLILNDPFPFFGKGLIAGGLALVIFFSNPQRNLLKTIASGLGTVALSLMNNFTDVVSYIRLFAIGLAGVAIADTVNTLASELGNSAVLGKVLIVFIGHTINIILAPMSVLVHGIRLNVLEFSSHAGLSWSGVSYHPLQDKPGAE